MNSAAIQSLIDSGNSVIELGAGEHFIDAALDFRNKTGITFRGVGPATILKVTGNVPKVLNINGVAYSKFENFNIRGDGTEDVNIAVHCYWYPPEAPNRTTTRVQFERIDLRDVKYVTGFKFGYGPGYAVQCDDCKLESVIAVGNYDPAEARHYQTGFMFGAHESGNNVMHYAYHCHSRGHRDGVHVDTSQLGWYGGCTMKNEKDFIADTLGFFKVSGVRSEQSGCMLWIPGQDSNAGQYSMEAIDWHGQECALDGQIISFKKGGYLKLDGVSVRGCRVKPQIVAHTWVDQFIDMQGLQIEEYDIQDVLQIYQTCRARAIYTRIVKSAGVYKMSRYENITGSVTGKATFA